MNLINTSPYQKLMSLDYKILFGRTNIQFMDVEIRIEKDILRSRVLHESPYEPYVLPYILNDRIAFNHLTLIRAALLRAVRTCIHIEDFDVEIKHLQFSLMKNNFSPYDIQESFRLFYKEFTPIKSTCRYRQHTYDILRQSIRVYDERCQITSINQCEQIQVYHTQLIAQTNTESWKKTLKRRWENEP